MRLSSLLDADKWSKFLKDRFRGDSRPTYSQCGEDAIVDFVFVALGIDKPSYLDIGAHHPTRLSNTYRFYRAGSRGVLVEPDPALHRVIKLRRRGDICLNVGVGTGSAAEADFYIMSVPTLNTFSREEADKVAGFGEARISSVRKLPLVTIGDILDKHMPVGPRFVSIDVEGMDFEILRTFDFSRYRPLVFCVETVSFTIENEEVKDRAIADLMLRNGYMEFADTHINTIFVDQKAWREK
jgi:FkbM family methyltransferase